MATQTIKKESIGKALDDLAKDNKVESACTCKEIGKVHITPKQIKEMKDKIDRVEQLTKAITKTFEKEKWKQNEYWEEDNGVLCASFIDINLDQVSVFIDRD
jgi:hypothetical protein